MADICLASTLAGRHQSSSWPLESCPRALRPSGKSQDIRGSRAGQLYLESRLPIRVAMRAAMTTMTVTRRPGFRSCMHEVSRASGIPFLNSSQTRTGCELDTTRQGSTSYYGDSSLTIHTFQGESSRLHERSHWSALMYSACKQMSNR